MIENLSVILAIIILLVVYVCMWFIALQVLELLIDKSIEAIDSIQQPHDPL